MLGRAGHGRDCVARRLVVPAICLARASNAARARSPMDQRSFPKASTRRCAARCPGNRGPGVHAGRQHRQVLN
eukprot:406834-Lingulodinium_polyedra.AAC.1